MTIPPNFKKGTGRLATDRYDFEAHLEGRNPDAGSTFVHSFRHKASQVDIDNPSLVFGNATDVEGALEDIKGFIDIFSSIGQGFVTIGDGYNTWHNANGTINFDPAIPSIDGILNAISNYVDTGLGGLTAYDRIKHGGIILIKAGTYIVKNTINLAPGLIIMGEGYGTKLVNATGLTIPVLGLAPSYRSTFNIFNVTSTTPISVQTSVPHDIVTGETLVISGVTGIVGTGPTLDGTAPNGTFTVTVTGVDTFTLDGSVYTSGAYGGGGAVKFARPMFHVLPSLPATINDRANNDAKIIDPTDPALFMFSRSTKFVNLVIADNFVENTVSTDVFYSLPQNREANNPLILQSQGSNLELNNVYFMGRINDSTPPIVDIGTSSAIQLDTTVINQITTGTFLKINDCFIDGFSQPIGFNSSGGRNDYLEINSSKIRSHGYLNGDGVTATNNCIINMNDNNAIITDNFFYGNHDLLKQVVFVKNTIGIAPAAGDLANIDISSNDFVIGKGDVAAVVGDMIIVDAGIIGTFNQFAHILFFGNNNNGGFTVGTTGITANPQFYVDQDNGSFRTATAIGISSPQTFITATTELGLTSPNLTTTLATTTIGSTGTPHQLIVRDNNGTFIDATVSGTSLGSASTPHFLDVSDNNGVMFEAGPFRTLLPKSIIHRIYTVTANYTSDTNAPDYILLVDSSIAAITITLPFHDAGRMIIIKDIGFNAAVNNITLARQSGTGAIEDYVGDRVLATSGASWTLVSNGTNWYII